MTRSVKGKNSPRFGNMIIPFSRQRPGRRNILNPNDLYLQLRASVDCWLGSSLTSRLVLWLSIGIMAAKELALPPYLTWLSGVSWWGICCGQFFRKSRKTRATDFMVLLAIAGAASFSVYWSHVEYSLSELVEANRPVSVLARILKISDQTSSQRSVVIDIKGTLLPQGIKLDKGRAIITQVPYPGETMDADLNIGDMVIVTGSFRKPRKASNPGQFNYGHYLYRRGIGLTAYVEGNSAIRKLPEAEQGMLPAVIRHSGFPSVPGWLWLQHKLHQLRDRLVAVWDGYLPARLHGLLAAMVLGDRNSLDSEIQEAFRRTGQAHLLSVSGLHIGFVAGVIWFLLRPLPRGRLFRCVGTILIAWLYALVVGGNPPVIRATLTLSLYLLTLAWGRAHDRLAATGWAAVLQLLVNPSLLFDTSFQLSYGALLGILSLTPVLHSWLLPRHIGGPWPLKMVAKLLDLLILSVSAQLAIFPLLAYYFYETSLIGPILSLVTVPLTGLIVPLGLLGSLVGLIVNLQAYLAPVLGVLLAVLEKLIRVCASWSWARIHLSAGSVFTWIAYYALLTYALQYLKRRIVLKWLGIPIFAPGKGVGKVWLARGLIIAFCLVYYPLVAPFWRPLEITFLDVGQGDAIFLNTPSGRNMLIDGGGLPLSYSESAFDVGENIVLPFLRQRGVRRLDLVVATHFHNDHTQGLGAVLRELPVTLLGDNGKLDMGFASQQYRRLLRELQNERSIKPVVLHRGHYLSLSGKTELTVLHPAKDASATAGVSGTETPDQNNESVVLKLRTPYYSLLFTGDIDKAAQIELVRQHALLAYGASYPSGETDGLSVRKRAGPQASLEERFGLGADLLKVPHHGSREALVYSFLGAVAPSQTVISVGANPFGHPAREFLYALELVAGNTPWQTDMAGSIRVRIWGSRVKIDSYHSQPWWRVGSWPMTQQWESGIRRRCGRV